MNKNNGVLECSCGYRRNYFNSYDTFIMWCHKILNNHKLIRSTKDILKECK